MDTSDHDKVTFRYFLTASFRCTSLSNLFLFEKNTKQTINENGDCSKHRWTTKLIFCNNVFL